MDVIVKRAKRECEFSQLELRNGVFVGEQNVPPELEIDEYDGMAVHFIALVDGVIATARLFIHEDSGKKAGFAS